VACPTPAVGSNVVTFTTGNVTTATSRDQCVAVCNDRSVLNATANTCTPCTTPPNCATPGAACFGSSSQLTCTTCAAGYALNATANSCTACTTLPADCATGDGTCFGATTQQTCAACNGGFALNATANTCTACTTPPNCDTPGAACFDSSSQLTCTTCAAGYALNATANTCTACTTLPADCGNGNGTCFGATTQQTCAACNGGFALNATANTCAPDPRSSCNPSCASDQVCINSVCIGDGPLRITLTWDTSGDMDLHVLTPCGTEISYNNETACGGKLDVDSGGTGPENVVWTAAANPNGPPSGTYLICPEAYTSEVVGATYTLVIFRDGAEVYRTTGTRSSRDGDRACSASYPGVVTYVIP